jgi:hypothetical protein
MNKKNFVALIGSAVLCSARAGIIGVDVTNGESNYVSGIEGLTIGWQFQVTATNGITIDGLGFWDDGADGFAGGQTFPAGVWDPTTTNLLRSTVVGTFSAKVNSLDTNGCWRVTPITPLYLPAGTYRIGAVMPVTTDNKIINLFASTQTGPGIDFEGMYLYHSMSIGLTMPDTPSIGTGAANFGPTFTYFPGPPPLPGSVVAPAAYTLTNGNGGLSTLLGDSNNTWTYQMQFSSNVLGGLPAGAKITELRFRLNTNATGIFPSNTVQWGSYRVILAQAANPVASMSPYFYSNMTAPVLVKNNTIDLLSNNFTAGASPNAFGPFIVFDTPYVYPGGDLVIAVINLGSDSDTSGLLDALTNGMTGDGTLFRAWNTNSYDGTAGVPAPVTIVQMVFNYALGASISSDGTNVVIVGTGGLPGDTYHLLSTTNLTMPLSNWTVVTSNVFDTSNRFRYSNVVNRTVRAQFYRIALP